MPAGTVGSRVGAARFLAARFGVDQARNDRLGRLVQQTGNGSRKITFTAVVTRTNLGGSDKNPGSAQGQSLLSLDGIAVHLGLHFDMQT